MTSFQNPSQDVIASYLKNAKTIAVVGLSYRENSPAYGVSKIMQEAGYTTCSATKGTFPYNQ